MLYFEGWTGLASLPQRHRHLGPDRSAAPELPDQQRQQGRENRTDERSESRRQQRSSRRRERRVSAC